MARVVVDTNIIFSALVSAESAFAEVLLRSGHEFFVCEMTIVELFKHKEKLIKASHLSEDDIARMYHILLRRVAVYKEDLIDPEHRKAAYILCSDIDEFDTPHIALTLELDGLLWTGDKQLRNRLEKRVSSNFLCQETINDNADKRAAHSKSAPLFLFIAKSAAGVSQPQIGQRGFNFTRALTGFEPVDDFVELVGQVFAHFGAHLAHHASQRHRVVFERAERGRVGEG